MRQEGSARYVGNACGTIACLHSLANNAEAFADAVQGHDPELSKPFAMDMMNKYKYKYIYIYIYMHVNEKLCRFISACLFLIHMRICIYMYLYIYVCVCTCDVLCI